jgi:protein subunit release factor B
VIPGDEIHVEFTRSGGPGGQNVNKVESCAVLRFSVRDSRSLSAEAKSRLEASLRTRLTRKGEVIVRAERHRERRGTSRTASSASPASWRAGSIDQLARSRRGRPGLRSGAGWNETPPLADEARAQGR